MLPCAIKSILSNIILDILSTLNVCSKARMLNILTDSRKKLKNWRPFWIYANYAHFHYHDYLDFFGLFGTHLGDLTEMHCSEKNMQFV